MKLKGENEVKRVKYTGKGFFLYIKKIKRPSAIKYAFIVRGEKYLLWVGGWGRKLGFQTDI
jgi:hypothetical protein